LQGSEFSPRWVNAKKQIQNSALLDSYISFIGNYNQRRFLVLLTVNSVIV